MGRAFSKQSDVLIASWAAGVEVLISTKTMLSSYQKNLRNRFEEGYGDAKNLRGRHPMASLGFLFIAGSDIPPTSLTFAVDMLRKLTAELDVYDCACLLVIDGAQGAHEDTERAGRAVDEEPAALMPLDAGPPHDDDSDDELEPRVRTVPEYDDVGGVVIRTVSLVHDAVPPDLGADRFFQVLISRALDRMPVTVYPAVRERRSSAAD